MPVAPGAVVDVDESGIRSDTPIKNAIIANGYSGAVKVRNGDACG
jgi:hypothetical protein